MARYYATQYFIGDGQTTRWNISFAGARPDTNSGTTAWFETADVLAATIVRNADGSETETALTVTVIGPTQIDIIPAVPAGTEFKIYRSSEREYPMVDFNDYSALTASELDEAFRQTLYGVQELSDLVTYSDLRSLRAAVLAQAAAEDSKAAVSTATAADTSARNAEASASAARAAAEAAENVAANSDAGKVVAIAQDAQATAKAAASTATEAKAAAEESSKAAASSEALAKTSADSAEQSAKDVAVIKPNVEALQTRTTHRRFLTDFPLTSTEEARMEAAIAQVDADGGGELYIPAGSYSYTGTASCTLNTAVAIHLESGAILKQTVDADMWNFKSASFGQITIKGNGQIWPMFSGKSENSAAIRINYGVVRLYDFTLWQSTKPGSFRYGVHLTDASTPTLRDLSLNDDGDALHTTGVYATTDTHFSVDWSIRNVGTYALREAFKFEAKELPTTTIEGVKFQHCYFVSNYNGVVWAAKRHAPMLTLDTCHINTASSCIDVSYGLEVQINNCVLYRYAGDTAPFIKMYNSQDVQIIGGKCSNTDSQSLNYIDVSGLTAFLRVSDVYFANNVGDSCILKVSGEASKLYLDSSNVNGSGRKWLDLSGYTGAPHAIQVAPDLAATAYDAGTAAVPSVAISDGSINLGTTAVGGFLRVTGSAGESITKFTNYVPGAVYTLYFDTPGITIPHAAGSLLSNDQSYTVYKAGESITFRGSPSGVREICRSNPLHVKARGSTTVPAFSVAAGQTVLVHTVSVSGVSAGDVVDFSLVNNDRTDILITTYCVSGTVRVYATAPAAARSLPATAATYTIRAMA